MTYAPPQFPTGSSLAELCREIKFVDAKTRELGPWKSGAFSILASHGCLAGWIKKKDGGTEASENPPVCRAKALEGFRGKVQGQEVGVLEPAGEVLQPAPVAQKLGEGVADRGGVRGVRQAADEQGEGPVSQGQAVTIDPRLECCREGESKRQGAPGRRLQEDGRLQGALRNLRVARHVPPKAEARVHRPVRVHAAREESAGGVPLGVEDFCAGDQPRQEQAAAEEADQADAADADEAEGQDRDGRGGERRCKQEGW